MRLGERLTYVAIGLIIAIGFVLARFSPDFLESYYLAEDGILEWLIVAVFLYLAVLCFWRVMRLRSVRPTLFLLSIFFIGLAFVFGAGEELSWGQRIFSIDTPEWLKEHNRQKELNVHNLMVGDISINKVVFGTAFAVCLILYLLLLPRIAERSPRVNSLVERLGLPLPTKLQSIAFILALALPDLLVDSKETDELREVCGALMLLVLFCYPQNGYIYSPGWRVGEQKTG